jgi:hypothetical protein
MTEWPSRQQADTRPRRVLTQTVAGLIGCAIALVVALIAGEFSRGLRAPVFVVVASVYLVLTYRAADRLDRASPSAHSRRA